MEEQKRECVNKQMEQMEQMDEENLNILYKIG